jgi:hypothetical protein
VRSSPQRSELFRTTIRQLLAEENATREDNNERPIPLDRNHIKNLILDVQTRWNSTLAMITRALDLQEAVDRLCNDEKRIKCAIFRRYKLSQEDWQILRTVAEWLKVRFLIFNGFLIN